MYLSPLTSPDPSGARTTTVWNYENQPTLYKLPDATRVTMAYHPDLLRVQKDTAAGTTKFIWDDQNYLAEADGSNVVTMVYTNEPERYGRLVSAGLATGLYYGCLDGSGSTRQTLTSKALQTDAWLFDAWGNTKARIGAVDLGLVWIGSLGYYRDAETADYVIRRRPYLVQLSRWSTPDPIGLLATRNLYCYSENAPMQHVDPSGLLSQKNHEGWLPNWINWGFLCDAAEDSMGPYTIKVVGNCGAFIWVTDWVLGPKESDGFIVQKVSYPKWNIEACRLPRPNKCDLRMPLRGVCTNTTNCAGCYVEIWGVTSGVVHSANPLESPAAVATDATDTFASFGCSNSCTTGCTHGMIHQKGEAFFIDGKRLTNGDLHLLKRIFQSPPNGLVNACRLNSACLTTDIEHDLKQLKTGPLVFKEVKRSWNCCGSRGCDCCKRDSLGDFGDE